MKWVTALLVGALLGMVLPTAFDGRSGNWMDTWAAWGTIRPHAGSPGLLFSIPLFVGTATALRAIFSWHTN